MSTRKRGTGICECCGAKTVEYRHSLTKGLVSGLLKIVKSGHDPINLKELGLTRNEWDNFQKLRYWQFVEQCEAAGVWRTTYAGRAWAKNQMTAAKYAWTYRGVLIGYEGDKVCVTQVCRDMPFYQQIKDFI